MAILIEKAEEEEAAAMKVRRRLRERGDEEKRGVFGEDEGTVELVEVARMSCTGDEEKMLLMKAMTFEMIRGGEAGDVGMGLRIEVYCMLRK